MKLLLLLLLLLLLKAQINHKHITNVQWWCSYWENSFTYVNQATSSAVF